MTSLLHEPEYTVVIPITPTDLMGKEPTFADIESFARKNMGDFGNPESASFLPVLRHYRNSIDSSWETGYYTLNGTLKMESSEQITQDKIEAAYNMDSIQSHRLPMCNNYRDVSSLLLRRKMFVQILAIIQGYYDHEIYNMYKTRGCGYLSAFNLCNRPQ